MLPLRVLIVDDEPLARERARRLLAKVGNVEIVREIGSAREALEHIEQDPPDVVLLDINMPELDGLRLIEALDDPPAIILATAYEHHALRAFELDVVDYLLKPYSAERLGKALQRVRRQLGAEEANASHSTPPPPAATRVAADIGHGTELINIHDLAGAVIEEGVVFLLRSDGERLCYAGTLQELEQTLPQPPILRASRSTLVNLDLVQRFHTNDEGGLVLNLAGDHEAHVSRRRARFFRARLK